jgi:hypothetical protein
VRRHTTLWNASASQSFRADKSLTAFVRVYDLLHQRSNITRSITSTSLTDRESVVLGQYFLVGLTYNPSRAARYGR